MKRPVPGRRYTAGELRAFLDQEGATALQAQGYVLRHNVSDDTYQLVHWTNAAGGEEFGTFRKDQRVAYDPHAFNEADLPPIVKRTPQQRVDSLMLRFIEDCQRTGTIPGVGDERIREIVGEWWKAGKTEMTTEVVRAVAARLLQQAEAKREADNFKRTVRI